jgi:ribosome-associated protein
VDALPVTATLTLPAADLQWSAVRASGPGGQNVNKIASQVELRFDLRATTALTGDVKARLAKLAGRRLTQDGVIVVACQVHRSQERNLEEARQRLADLVRRALQPPKPRKKTRPGRAAKERRLAEKRRRGERKRERSVDE